MKLCTICLKDFNNENSNSKICSRKCRLKKRRDLNHIKETRTCNKCSQVKNIAKSGWHADNTCSACYAREKYKNNGEVRKNNKENWRKNNKEHCKKWNNIYIRKKMKEDINFKLKKNLRNRLNQAVKNNQKSGSAIIDLGCSMEEFKTYIKILFQPGMSWDNYGKWHIDHIKPLSKFNLTNREELLKACNYTNLQPLWAKDNLRKGDKWLDLTLKNV